jgi:hypothetical protein
VTIVKLYAILLVIFANLFIFLMNQLMCKDEFTQKQILMRFYIAATKRLKKLK